MIYLELILAFAKIGICSVGGGYAAIPLVQAQAVTLHGWLTMNEFTDLVTIAEMTPGPIAVNAATFVGLRTAGIGGALCATFGDVLPSCLIVSLLGSLYFRFKSKGIVDSILGTLRAAVVGLIASAGVSILRLVTFGDGAIAVSSFIPVGFILFAAAFFVLRKFKLSPIPVMLSCGVLNLVINVLITRFA